MFITSRNIVYYLLEKGLLTSQSIVDGDFMVVDTSRRNNNFKVIRKHQPSYFVKQVKNWEPQAISSLQREANCYWLAHNDTDFIPLAGLLSKYYFYDQNRHILIIELISEAESLHEYHLRLGKFPIKIAIQLGKILGMYHQQAGKKLQNDQQNAIFPKTVPWILSAHQQNPQFFISQSAGGSQILNIIQSYPELHQELDKIRNQWQFNSLIHGDMKWDNFIVYPDEKEKDKTNLKLVDWELADFGDANWDVGGVLQSYISFWIMSIQITGETPPVQFVDLAKYPIEEMHPAIQAFWKSYTEVMGIKKSDADLLLERCVKYGAARMIQTAYEYTYLSAQISLNVVCLLQASLNILKNPKEAIHHLLGMEK